MKGLKKLISNIYHILHNHVNFDEVGQTKQKQCLFLPEISWEFFRAPLIFSAKPYEHERFYMREKT